MNGRTVIVTVSDQFNSPSDTDDLENIVCAPAKGRGIKGWLGRIRVVQRDGWPTDATSKRRSGDR